MNIYLIYGTLQSLSKTLTEYTKRLSAVLKDILIRQMFVAGQDINWKVMPNKEYLHRLASTNGKHKWSIGQDMAFLLFH